MCSASAVQRTPTASSALSSAILGAMEPSLIPVCSFEALDAGDIISAIRTKSGPHPRRAVRVAPLGFGYEKTLKWAIQDIEEAARSTSNDRQVDFSVNALMNARRSLSCLSDEYLARDCFAFCKGAPREANEKSDLLVRRGVFDSPAAGALRRAVERRNRIEHRYEQVSLEDAQDTVHLIRSAIENCVTRSDPYQAPVFFGSFLGGHSGGEGEEKHWFHGWSGLLFVLARCESPPWFGVIIPSSKTEATVRRIPFSELTCEQLLEVLATLELQSSAGLFQPAESTFARQLAFLGLR
jgi:hypothetical protein